MAIRKVTCDCLNWCGDDPWLNNGRAQPCAAWLARVERERVIAEQTVKIAELRTTFGAADIFDLLQKMHSELQAARTAALNEGVRAGNLESTLSAIDRQLWDRDGAELAQYATTEETASVMRQATPDEKWLHEQLDRIDPHRHEMGSAGDTPALVKLVFELREMLLQKATS